MTARIIVLLAVLLTAACSPGDEQAGKPAASGDHVWKDQVGAMDKAKAAEQAVMDAAAKQADAIRDQSE